MIPPPSHSPHKVPHEPNQGENTEDHHERLVLTNRTAYKSNRPCGQNESANQLMSLPLLVSLFRCYDLISAYRCPAIRASVRLVRYIVSAFVTLNQSHFLSPVLGGSSWNAYVMFGD